VQHHERSTVDHFHDDLGAAHPLAGKAGEAVAGGVAEHTIEGGDKSRFHSSTRVSGKPADKKTAPIPRGLNPCRLAGIPSVSGYLPMNGHLV
jgi:hypothetical protein